jgi:hypothetical protein
MFGKLTCMLLRKMVVLLIKVHISFFVSYLHLFTSEQSSRTFLKNTFLITQDVSLTVYEGKILITISIVFKKCSLCSNNYNNECDGRVADA